MNLGLKLSLATAGGGQRMDADAAAYIAALEDGGATVSSVQSSAIDTFIRAEKIALRWDLIKRLYLPIWGLAAPNAICLRSLASGTFVASGASMHQPGYVQGNGTTQYFEVDASMTSLGASASSASFFFLRSLIPVTGQRILGSLVGTRAYLLGRAVSGFAGGEWIGGTPVSAWSSGGPAESPGMSVMSRHSGQTHLINLNGSGLYSTSLTYADQGAIGASKAHFMAINGSTDSLSTARWGVMGQGVGMSLANTEASAQNLKKLWETCTGLSLPA